MASQTGGGDLVPIYSKLSTHVSSLVFLFGGLLFPSMIEEEKEVLATFEI